MVNIVIRLITNDVEKSSTDDRANGCIYTYIESVVKGVVIIFRILFYYVVGAARCLFGCLPQRGAGAAADGGQGLGPPPLLKGVCKLECLREGCACGGSQLFIP